jgi:hypothetical protein
MHRLSILVTTLTLLDACHATVPTRPEELDDGSFAIKLSGIVAVPRRITVDEVVTGSACRIGEFIRLDSRSMNRRFLIRFPRMASTAASYEFAYPQQGSGAQAHLMWAVILTPSHRSISSTVQGLLLRDHPGKLSAVLKVSWANTLSISVRLETA